MSDCTIYHNPACGTSRNVLALLRHAGLEPTVVEYLKTPPSKERLRELLAAMGLGVRALLARRSRSTPSSASATRSGATSGCWTSSSATRS